MSSLQQPPLYREPFRPQYHYSAPQAWLNDPNGLVYYEGEYHLFYQYHPDSTTWGPMHWGHAVSPDLLHWETLPIALYPDDLGTIFSGCVVVDAQNTSGLVPGGGLVAVYSYHTQTQGVAYSTDRGRTWTKYSENPIMPAVARDFRDPKVFWHAETGRWVMIIAAGPEIHLYTSANLLDWEPASVFTGGYRGGVWEVPDLVAMELNGETHWVLIVGVSQDAPSGGSGTRYFVGSFDGQTFTDRYPDETLWFDYGPDNYAGTTFFNAPGGRHVLIGWMNNWIYANEVPTSTWRGVMTVPHDLSLAETPDGIRLVHRPAAELETLREPLGTWQDVKLEGDWRPGDVTGRVLEIVAEIEPGTAETLGFKVHAGEDGDARIFYDVAKEQLFVSRPGAGVSNFNRLFDMHVPLQDGRIALHILLDEASLEIFTADGLSSFTAQIFLDPAQDGLELFAYEGTARIVNLAIYRLESVWPQAAE